MSAALVLVLLAGSAPVDDALRAVEIEAAKEQAAGRDVESLMEWEALKSRMRRRAECPKPTPCAECPTAPRLLIEVAGVEIESGRVVGIAQAWSSGDFPELRAQLAFEIPLPAVEPTPAAHGWSTRTVVAWALLGVASGALLAYLGSR